ncbi:hypothetical protein TWF217_003912 [Orbilia oligospora]|nr:hypothetical protein TWF217_003912 [Orbilia oligospora]
MLDLFYRRPTSTCSNGTFDTITSCEKGICPEIDGIPAKLSFDRVVSGYTSAPCTLEDFSRYLRFSNMNDHADALQFFVWVRRYSKRFETSLTSTEKSLSPPWENVSPVMDFDSSSQVSINYPSSNNSSKADLSQVGFGDDIVLEPSRNLSPWEVYAVDDRESFEAGGSGKSEIEVGISEIDAELEGKVKDEETRIRWFVKEYDNRPILSRVFEKRVPVKDPEIRHLQLSMIVQNAIISFGITTAIEIIFVALPRGHLF